MEEECNQRVGGVEGSTCSRPCVLVVVVVGFEGVRRVEGSSQGLLK